MPCMSVPFNPSIGPVINVIFACPGTLRQAADPKAIPANIIVAALLIDTGADITCVAEEITNQLGLRPSGKVPVSVPTGQASANTHVLDVGIPFGDMTQSPEIHVRESLNIMEYAGASPHYKGLLGRDILSNCLFSIAGYDKRYTICV